MATGPLKQRSRPLVLQTLYASKEPDAPRGASGSITFQAAGGFAGPRSRQRRTGSLTARLVARLVEERRVGRPGARLALLHFLDPLAVVLDALLALVVLRVLEAVADHQLPLRRQDEGLHG